MKDIKFMDKIKLNFFILKLSLNIKNKYFNNKGDVVDFKQLNGEQVLNEVFNILDNNKKND